MKKSLKAQALGRHRSPGMVNVAAAALVLSTPFAGMGGAMAESAGVAVGENARAAKGSVAIGNGVVNDEAGTVQFAKNGEAARLKNVAAGKDSYDGVNLGQSKELLEKAVSKLRTEMSAQNKAAVDAGVKTAVTESVETAGEQAKKYTDAEVAKAKGAVTEAVKAVGTEAKRYTDVEVAKVSDTVSKTVSEAVNTALKQSSIPKGKVKDADSLAIGTGSDASGDRATAVGTNAQAYGNDATAVGQNARASESNGSAFGQNTNASGDASTAIGASAGAVGLKATAIGAASIASERGTAIGTSAQASEEATAIGLDAVAGAESIAMGVGATAKNGAVAIGNGVVNEEAATVQFAQEGESKRLKGVADGKDDTDAVNVGQNKAMMDRLTSEMRGEMTAVGQTSVSEAVKQSTAYTDQRVVEIRRDMASMDRTFRRGIASTAALMMAAPYAPGKVAATAGTAMYRGTAAVAVGASYWNRKGTWNVNGGVSTAGGNSTIVRLGGTVLF